MAFGLRRAWWRLPNFLPLVPLLLMSVCPRQDHRLAWVGNSSIRGRTSPPRLMSSSARQWVAEQELRVVYLSVRRRLHWVKWSACPKRRRRILAMVCLLLVMDLGSR